MNDLILRQGPFLSFGFQLRVRKILNLRVFEDESGKHWSKSVMDKQYEVLCVSQFTLQCILKGNKPDYHMAMPTDQAETFYNSFVEHLRKSYKPELIKGKAKLKSWINGKSFLQHNPIHFYSEVSPTEFNESYSEVNM